MKIHQLRALIAVADAGSVRGAARMLDSSPAAVTQCIQQLEETVRMQLVVRTSSGVTLTASGQTLLVHARLVAAQMTRAHQAMNAIRGEPSGRLSIAVTAWVALTFLPETVARFRAKMPTIQLELFEGLLAIATPRLRDGSLDIYVGRQAPGATSCDFTYQPLFASSRAVVARQDHPRAECRSLAELRDADWLVALDPETDAQAPYQIFGRRGFPAPRSIHFLHSLTVAVALLKRTDMLSIFPWPLVELCAARDGLCAIPLRDELDESTVGIIVRTGEPPDAASRCFIDCLIETIRDQSWARTVDIRRAMQSVEVLV
ncbi:LysR substrate-binding domain-containing protein [Paraburkholderia kirstenboschensis]|uniref:LysR substrate-binding domain-containing protein n=1 Tax=Paraburkholderia kirstenboschensis TaxID=1245436 RepID=A0ABZ0EHQ9_9BURK|nr:LysR substrate-binding domain-containing protein [Paraburkholderia kirstenboschensis]WOD16485.1 LysR substrate-binding domain-containing protein [Paraburkholderia kirstenboschensis]